MNFILSCLFCCLIGSFTGFFAHLFYGFIHHDIQFNWEYIRTTIFNFLKVVFTMTMATLLIAIIILVIPDKFYPSIGLEMGFIHQLIYYLLAFAAFDYGLKN
jgi:hypothetical protein